MECLLALIEMMQFQEYMIKGMNSEDMVHIIDIDRIRFALNIPASFIIEEEIIYNMKMIIGHKFTYEAKIKAYKIYEKYIKYGCEFEINISGTQRRSIGNLMEDYDLWLAHDISNKDLFMLFEDCKTELLKLLRYSYDRLRSNPEGWAEIVAACTNGPSFCE